MPTAQTSLNTSPAVLKYSCVLVNSTMPSLRSSYSIINFDERSITVNQFVFDNLIVLRARVAQYGRNISILIYRFMKGIKNFL